VSHRLAVRAIIESCAGDEDCILDKVGTYYRDQWARGVDFLWSLTAELGLRPPPIPPAVAEEAQGDPAIVASMLSELMDNRENPEYRKKLKGQAVQGAQAGVYDDGA
jgi:hypothetical protein